MTKQEFSEYCKKNKVVVFGVPIIIFIVLLNTFVLAPSREAKRRARLGIKSKTPVATKSAVASKPAAKAPITPPQPIRAPFIPRLDDRIETRFAAKSVYPHLATSRNIFKKKEPKVENLIVEQVEETPEVVERPDISYHGFFTMGKDKVAILKLANELIYSKLGSLLKHTTFRLQSVSSEKIVVEDTSDDQREFEISLADTSSDKK